MPTKTKKLATGNTLSCLTVSNLEKAKHFFVDLLGFEVTDFQEKYNWMEVGTEKGSLIGIGEACDEGEEIGIGSGTNAIISIEVHDLEEAIAHLKANKVKFIGEIMEVPNQIKMILFEDFDGNRFFLSQNLK